MKRRLLSIFLIVVLATALVTPMASANSLSDAYMAYAELIQCRLDMVGYLDPALQEPRMYYYDTDEAGLMFAKLLDFEGDGIDELILIESEEIHENSWVTYRVCWTVYAYWDDCLFEVAKDDIYIPQWNDYFGFSVGSNGKGYLVTNRTGSFGQSQPLTFYTISNGQWVCTNLQEYIRYDWSGTVNGNFYHSSTGTLDTWSINSQLVSGDVYRSTLNTLTGGGIEKYTASLYTHVKTLLPSGTPQQVLYELEEKMAAARRPSDWSADQVYAAIDQGIVSEQLQYNYTQPITRAEFCSLAVGLYESWMGQEIEGRMSFVDSYDPNVEKMGYLGVVNGVGNDCFDPDGILTREAAAVILMRLAETMGMPFPQAMPTYADNYTISSWALAQVGQAQAAGVMNGMGNNCFSPKTNYTREQSIVTIMRLNDLMRAATGQF